VGDIQNFQQTANFEAGAKTGYAAADEIMLKVSIVRARHGKYYGSQIRILMC
jgi:hypothetical protein